MKPQLMLLMAGYGVMGEVEVEETRGWETVTGMGRVTGVREQSTLKLSRELTQLEWDLLASHTDRANEWMAELSRHCPWMPTLDRSGLSLADVERIYSRDAAEWLKHLISVFLKPWKVQVEGTVKLLDAYEGAWKQIEVTEGGSVIHVEQLLQTFHFTPDGQLREVTLV